MTVRLIKRTLPRIFTRTRVVEASRTCQRYWKAPGRGCHSPVDAVRVAPTSGDPAISGAVEGIGGPGAAIAPAAAPLAMLAAMTNARARRRNAGGVTNGLVSETD